VTYFKSQDQEGSTRCAPEFESFKRQSSGGLERVSPQENKSLFFRRVDEIYLGDTIIPHSCWIKEKERGC
jgi:hypothetical protein